MDSVDHVKHAEWILERTLQQLEDAHRALNLVKAEEAGYGDAATASSLLESAARKASEVAEYSDHLAVELLNWED